MAVRSLLAMWLTGQSRRSPLPWTLPATLPAPPAAPLVDVEGNTFQIENLWGLHFGPSAEEWLSFLLDTDLLVEDAGSLYFTAGIVGDTHGSAFRQVLPARKW